MVRGTRNFPNNIDLWPEYNNELESAQSWKYWVKIQRLNKRFKLSWEESRWSREQQTWKLRRGKRWQQRWRYQTKGKGCKTHKREKVKKERSQASARTESRGWGGKREGKNIRLKNWEHGKTRGQNGRYDTEYCNVDAGSPNTASAVYRRIHEAFCWHGKPGSTQGLINKNMYN